MKKVWENLVVALAVSVGMTFHCGSTMAATHEVCQPAGTCDYDTIQEAIDASTDGDEVLVYDGTYVENIKFKGKFIIVRSENGKENTIIDGNGHGSVVEFSRGENRNSVLDGFTITNGALGGGIRIYYTSPTIRSCTVQGNASPQDGGGIYFKSIYGNEIPLIDNCNISNNSASRGGGGIYIEEGTMAIRRSIISNNKGGNSGGGIKVISGGVLNIHKSTISGNSSGGSNGGGLGIYQGNALGPKAILRMSNCIVSGNEGYSGGGIYFDGSESVITNSTFSGNVAKQGGGIANYRDTKVLIVNSIIWNNFPEEISEYYNAISVVYSNVRGGEPGTGNISKDPLFIDQRSIGSAPTSEGNYHIHKQSPCTDAGTDDKATYSTIPGDDIDGDPRPLGYGYDMGADEVFVDVEVRANAGPDQIVCKEFCGSVILDGRKSYSSDSRIMMSYDWKLNYRTNAAYNQTAVGENPTIANLEPGIYDVMLTVTDGAGLTDTDEMVLTVQDTCNPCLMSRGDLDSDGDVDGDDLKIFVQNYGTHPLVP